MTEKKKKQPRLKARLPRGFADRDAADIRAIDKQVETLLDRMVEFTPQGLVLHSQVDKWDTHR